MAHRTELFSDPTTQFDLRRLADLEPRRPKITMVKELRPDFEGGGLALAGYLPVVVIAVGLVVGVLLSLV